MGHDAIRIVDRAAVQALPDTAGVGSFEWSADGTALLLTREDRELWRYDVAGQRQTRIVAGFSRLRFPEPSPDGSRIAFAALRGDDPAESWSVWLCDGNGGNLRKLVDQGYGPSWSADGTTIYYEWMSQEKPDTRALFRIDANGGQPRPFLAQLTDDTGPYSVKCAPDGRTIAFCYRRRVHLYDAASGSIRPAPGHSEGRFCSFSADGSRLLIIDHTELHVIRLDDGSELTITPHGDAQELAYFQRRLPSAAAAP